jgi:hypothetical protein
MDVLAPLPTGEQPDVNMIAEQQEAHEAPAPVPRSRYPIYSPRDPFLLNDYEEEDEDSCEVGVDGRIWRLIPTATPAPGEPFLPSDHGQRQLVELTAFLRYLSRNSLAAAFVEEEEEEVQGSEEPPTTLASNDEPANEVRREVRVEVVQDPLATFINGCEDQNHGSDQFKQCRDLALHLDELSHALPEAVETALLRPCAAVASPKRVRQDLLQAYRIRRDVVAAWFPDMSQFLPEVTRDANIDGKFKLELRNRPQRYVMPVQVALSTGCFLTRQQKVWLLSGKFSLNLLNRYKGEKTPPVPIEIGVAIPFVITPHSFITGDVSIVNGDRPLSPQSLVARMLEFRAVNQIDLRKGHCVVDCRVQKLKQEHPPLFAIFLLELCNCVYVLVYEGDCCFYLCAPGGFPPATGIAVTEHDGVKKCDRLLGNLQILMTEREYVLEQALTRLFEHHYHDQPDAPPPTLHMLLRNGQKFDM